MTAVYTCGRCGSAVSKSTRVCPQCGANLAGIRCQQCGFVGGASDFVGDLCPKCRSVVVVSGQSSKSTEKTEKCDKCGRKKAASDWTCPHCGHTEWGTIAIVGVFGLLLLVAGLVAGPTFDSEVVRNLTTWGGVIVGGFFLLLTASEIITGLRS